MQRAWFIVKILERSATYRKSSNRHSGHSGHSQRTRPNTNNFQQRESATIVVMFVLSVCDIYFVMSCLLIVLFYTHVVLCHRPLCLKTFKQCPCFYLFYVTPHSLPLGVRLGSHISLGSHIYKNLHRGSCS